VYYNKIRTRAYKKIKIKQKGVILGKNIKFHYNFNMPNLYKLIYKYTITN